MCMIALLTFAFASCNKTEEEAKPHRSTFKACIEDPIYEDEDGGRAYLNLSRQIKFESGDVVMLFNLSTDNPLKSHCATYEAVPDDNTTHVDFQNCDLGEVAENMLDDGFYAYYPGNIDTDEGIERYVITELSGGLNKSKFLISPYQTYRENTVSRNALYLAAKVDTVANLTEAYFKFKCICGILALQPYEAARRSVKKIEIVDNEFPLTGWVELIMPELDPDEMTSMFNNYDPSNPAYVAQLAAYKERIGYAVDTTSDYGYKVTLNCEEAVQLGESRADTPVFYIVLRPLALSQGFHIVFTFDDGSVKDVDLSYYHNLLMRPNVIRPVGMNLDIF